ncbi:MAG: hypothetical protein H6R24_947 [Proteobacteria bacterium]|jgi:hypothetical protein|nr:hypothetical protein [Pseudomonadota bacterium]MBS1224269.1 hypothetical protein [Pseudomonadota bacterium]
MLTQDFKEFLELLNKNQVEYLIVGGYAVAMHGYPRYTGDLDIWINANRETAAKMIKVLDEFGFGSLGLRQTDFMESGNVIQMGYPPFRIDILTRADGVDFADCYRNRVIVEHDGVIMPIININDLQKNKAATGRPKDLEDLRNLNDTAPD